MERTCDKPDWEPTGFVYTTNPAQYGVRCKSCGGEDIWSKEQMQKWRDERNPDKIKIRELEARLAKLEKQSGL